MAMNWSRNAIENVSWDRYLMGWLPEEQVACLDMTRSVLRMRAGTCTPEAVGFADIPVASLRCRQRPQEEVLLRHRSLRST